MTALGLPRSRGPWVLVASALFPEVGGQEEEERQEQTGFPVAEAVLSQALGCAVRNTMTCSLRRINVCRWLVWFGLWDSHVWELSNKAYLSPEPCVCACVLLGREGVLSSAS